MYNVKKILVVSRSTKHCKKAVQAGISLAWNYKAELYILHVIYDPFSVEGWNLPVPNLEEEFKTMVANARKDLDRMVKAEIEKGLPVTELIKDGKPDKEIKKVVTEENIDLIIMLAHEEGRLEHFLFGRTNHEIIRDMPASILLVKSKS